MRRHRSHPARPQTLHKTSLMKNSRPTIATDLASEQSIEKMLNTIRIPPRPSLLTDVQQELSCSQPSPPKLAGIIGQDVAMSAALLKLANSAYIGLKLKAKSVEQAVMRLGMDQCSLLLTGILARETVQIEGVSLASFWDQSTKRSKAMSFYAKKFGICRSDVAHTVGLFCNIGVPLLMTKFPNYEAQMAAHDPSDLRIITAIENDLFHTSHTALGALMARTWGLPDEVVDAILLHHQYAVLKDQNTPAIVRGLIAVALLVDYGIQRYHSQQDMREWLIGGEDVRNYLGISQHDADDIADEIHAMFDGVAGS